MTIKIEKPKAPRRKTAALPQLSAAQEAALERATDAYSANIKRQALFWLGALAAFSFLLWMFAGILLPFVVGMTLAYFLDPVADRLERLGLSRLLASLTILITFIVVFIAFIMLVVPILAAQLVDFGAKLPSYIARLQALATDENMKWLHDTVGIDAATIQRNIGSILGQATSIGTTILSSVWTSAGTVVNIASLFVVTPVVAFYVLLDWDRMVDKVDSWVPRDHTQTVRTIGNDINTAIAGFIRGQGLVCIILGLMYATGLILVGLNFGLLIGMAAGLISFIPYIGSIIGLGLALIVAIVQFWPDWVSLMSVVLVFVIGQFIEGNILAPKLVGESIGLHPVWLMFALFAFGSLFGFVGLMIAVPAAAAIAVLVRFAIARYKQSPLYLGHTGFSE
ncbi:MAG: AI-2E family transporter [Rhizobiaceae bacterium]